MQRVRGNARALEPAPELRREEEVGELGGAVPAKGGVGAAFEREIVEIEEVAGVVGGERGLDDVCCKATLIGKRSVWTLQWNVEDSASPKVDNVGGALWILGHESGVDEHQPEDLGGGKTELLGGLFHGTGGPDEPGGAGLDAAALLAVLDAATWWRVAAGSRPSHARHRSMAARWRRGWRRGSL